MSQFYFQLAGISKFGVENFRGFNVPYLKSIYNSNVALNVDCLVRH